MWRTYRVLRTLSVVLLAAGALSLTTTSARAVDKDLAERAKSRDSDQRIDAAWDLAKEGSKDAVRLLARLIVDDDPWVRDNAVRATQHVKEAAALAPVEKLVTARAPLQRLNAGDALARTRLPDVLPTLRRLALEDGDPEVRVAALHDLAWFESDDAARTTAAAIAADAAADAAAPPDVHATALWMAGRLKAPGARELLEGALAHEDDRVRSVALLRLAWIDADAAAEHALAMLGDASTRVRSTCTMVARASRDTVALDVLVALVGDADPAVAAVAHRTLREVTRKGFQRDPMLWTSWWEQARAAWERPAKIDERRGRDDDLDTPAEIFGLNLTSGALAIVIETSDELAPVVDAETGRTRWDTLRDELATALDKLPDGTLVNVITVNDEVERAAPAPLRVSDATRRRLRAFLDKVRPKGGCDFWGGLRAGLDQPVDSVVVVSFAGRHSGDFVNESRVRDAAMRRYLLGRQVVHTVHLKQKDATDKWTKEAGNLMLDLAQDTLGRARYRTFP